MTSKSKVYFFFDKVSFTLRNRTKIKEVVKLVFKQEGKKLGQLNYIFCSDKALLEINRQYLQHNFYTDIITFDLSEKGGLTVGEIYISVDRVKENAQNLKEAFSKELKRVIFHGALHLCGYRDKTNNERKLMRKKEDHYLNR